MPIGSQLPPNTQNISLQTNQIANVSFEGWGENLSELTVVNMFGNPINEINVDNFTSMVRNCEGLLRVAFDTNINNISNYDQYIATLNALDEEGVTDGLLIDPYAR